MFQKKMNQADLLEEERRLLAEVKVEEAECEEGEGTGRERISQRGLLQDQRKKKIEHSLDLVLHTLLMENILSQTKCPQNGCLQALV